MSRWNNYLDDQRLDEKVNKKEIELALKNPDILIGCEFEFKVSDDLSSHNTDATSAYDQAYEEVREYNMDVANYESELEDYNDETEKLRGTLKKYEEKRDKITYAIEDQEEKVEDIKTEINNLRSTENAVAAWLAKLDPKSDKYKKEKASHDKGQKDLDSRIKFHEKRISALENGIDNLQKEVKALNRKIDDMERDIKYREEEGYWEEVEHPGWGIHNQRHYFDYMEDYLGYSRRDIEHVETGETVDFPPEPYQDDHIDFESAIQDSGILNSAPFGRDYEIGQYGSVSQSVGDRHWAVEPDESLGDNGVEIKNPPMELPKFMDRYLNQMLEWIDDVGYTDNDCGFHCHMSVKNSNSELDYLKLILFTDEEWIYQAFEDRAHSIYAKSVKDKMKSNTTISKKELDDLFGRKKLVMRLQMASEHFDSIRLISSKDGHVEFRFMGGRYNKKIKDIRATIATYAHNLSLAMDPEYRRKEYILKLQRIFNKMELFYLVKKKEVLNWLVASKGPGLSVADKAFFGLAMKDTDTKAKRLSSVYELDDKTERMLRSNTAFEKGVYGEIMSSLKKGFSKEVMAALYSQYPWAK